LLDILGPTEEATAGGYRQIALAVLEDLRRRGRLPIFTVGTGLYLRALLDGLANMPQRSEELRERLRASAAGHPPGHLHSVLRRMDRAAAELTWFRKEPGVQWLEGFGHDPKVQNAALLYLQSQGLQSGRGAETTSV
jgi:tRNA A37 N6-isopentenylltransferase MiaA